MISEMNLLFINYGDTKSNSLNHIQYFAKGLAKNGHECLIKIAPEIDLTTAFQNQESLRIQNIIVDEEPVFQNGRPADIVHAWTPRERVRKQVLSYMAVTHPKPKLVVHMEDNEINITSEFTGVAHESLIMLSERRLKKRIIDQISHPRRHQILLAVADAVTGIVPALKSHVPETTPFHLLFPGIDFAEFSTTRDQSVCREKYNISEKYLTIYPGSVNRVNFKEVKVIYEVLVEINRLGYSTRLIQTGQTPPWFREMLSDDEKAISTDLGFLEREELLALLPNADFFIQSGATGAYNDYRLPSKLPEYFATGRPVVMPRANIGQMVDDGREALLHSSGSVDEIISKCLYLLNNSQHADQIGQSGRFFAEKHFDIKNNIKNLEAIYKSVLMKEAVVDWTRISNNASDETNLFPIHHRDMSPEILLMVEMTKIRKGLLARIFG